MNVKGLDTELPKVPYGKAIQFMSLKNLKNVKKKNFDIML